MAEGRILPLGTVVLLEGTEELVCIIGHDVESADNGVNYKFAGVALPAGYASADNIYMFNSDAVKKIYSVGRMINEDTMLCGFGNGQCVQGLLPAGSIVKAKNSDILFLVIGAAATDSGKADKIFDYVAAPYPDGYVGPEYLFLFNREDIEDILHVGFLYDGQHEFEKEALSFISRERKDA